MSDVPPPPPAPPATAAPAKKRGCLVPALLTIIVVLLVVIGAWLWINRPIKPVQLSAEEKAAVEAKLEAVQAPSPSRPTYEKGAKEIILTERELNGLLNENTQLGNSLKFELVKGAVHARYETDLDKDLPVVGGKRLKARARFFINNDQGQPHLVLDDLTVWGVSLPNDWLGGLKGHDLLGDTLGQGRRGGGLAGVEDMQVEDGQIRIKLKE
ncbi:hypothetical protein KBB96_18465 [Luteolibacter ambystomatis]|uniref:Uncharacterized protein n=1 Tax=Luteolibacter ambystomatis TaxID=2824561 RepID=A0A975G9I7_9BACT|nr:hypothetical protein [Luteolibacter ambystomatis]QUE50830.1 hypothetical protein KBB96_18465 [Luteolibacter ambystomatis]